MGKNAFILRMKHRPGLVNEALDNDHLIIGWVEAEGLLEIKEWEEFREIRNGPKKLDSFSGVFKCTVASGYAALNSGFRL